MRMMDEGGNSLPLKEFLRSSEEGERGLSFSPPDAVGVAADHSLSDFDDAGVVVTVKAADTHDGVVGATVADVQDGVSSVAAARDAMAQWGLRHSDAACVPSLARDSEAVTLPETAGAPSRLTVGVEPSRLKTQRHSPREVGAAISSPR